ncbi:MULTISPECIES: VOC family protein [Paenibacillus]|uniref:VOC family protein n=1 Tax=Paenibacillus TaxID=44249 RepID=UPI0022B85B31|nr:VOC family protein [Paenibacillus caseinilyticus]MCZ8522142.1 VOC family protein [Paenibacillus caseinilyticus]
MAVLRPYLYGGDVREQAAFYAGALQGEVKSVRTYGEGGFGTEETRDKVMHLELQAAGLLFYLADSVTGTVERGSGLDLNLEFVSEEEARSAFEGLSAGGEVLMPLAPMFWGALFGRLKDPYGVQWQISTPRQGQ